MIQGPMIKIASLLILCCLCMGIGGSLRGAEAPTRSAEADLSTAPAPTAPMLASPSPASTLVADREPVAGPAPADLSYRTSSNASDEPPLAAFDIEAFVARRVLSCDPVEFEVKYADLTLMQKQDVYVLMLRRMMTERDKAFKQCLKDGFYDTYELAEGEKLPPDAIRKDAPPGTPVSFGFEMGPGPKGVSYKIVNITKDSHPELDSMIQEEGWLFNHLHKLGLPADQIVR